MLSDNYSLIMVQMSQKVLCIARVPEIVRWQDRDPESRVAYTSNPLAPAGFDGGVMARDRRPSFVIGDRLTALDDDDVTFESAQGPPFTLFLSSST